MEELIWEQYTVTLQKVTAARLLQAAAVFLSF